MKLRKRHIYILIAVFSGVGFLWATNGHLFRLRTETKQFCHQIDTLLCSPGHKITVDIMDEHRIVVMDVFIILFGLSLIGFIINWFQYLKAKYQYDANEKTKEVKKPIEKSKIIKVKPSDVEKSPKKL